jgi:hypothetical protein
MSWGKRSRTIINQIVCDHPRAEDEDDAAYKKRLVKAIAEGYPYAQRSGFAYQAWLRERRKILYNMGLESRPPKSCRDKEDPPSAQQLEAEGQLNLFNKVLNYGQS